MELTETQMQEHVRRMTERFSPYRALARCECCGREETLPVELEWRGIYHTTGTLLVTVGGLLALVGGHGVLAHNEIVFTTTHGLCKGCLWRVRWRRAWGELAGYGCFTLLLLGLLFFVTWSGITVSVLLQHTSGRELVRLLGGEVLGLAVVAGAFLGARKAPGWGVPTALREVAVAPFQLRRLDKV